MFYEDGDVFFLNESKSNLGSNLIPSLHVISQTLARLLAHTLQLFFVGNNFGIELILLNE